MSIVGADIEDGADPRRALAQRNQEVRLLCTQVHQLRHKIANNRAKHDRQTAVLKRRLLRIDQNLVRFVTRPAFRFSNRENSSHATVRGGTIRPSTSTGASTTTTQSSRTQQSQHICNTINTYVSRQSQKCGKGT
jgi:hypothetical protein